MTTIKLTSTDNREAALRNVLEYGEWQFDKNLFEIDTDTGYLTLEDFGTFSFQYLSGTPGEDISTVLISDDEDEGLVATLS